MPTLEEVLAGESTSEYMYVEGYAVDNNYVDENFVEILDRVIGDTVNNVSAYGEELSQAITFKMARYVDGIDLTATGKLIKIHYELADGTGSDDAPINVKCNDTSILLTWVIPAAATVMASKIQFIVYVIGDNYIFKTLSAPYTINKSLDIGGGLPEPDVSWYTDFVRQMEAYVAQAEEAARKAIGTKYVFIRYSVNDDGTDFHATPTEADDYIGFAVCATEEVPTDKTVFTWYKAKGDKGDTGNAATVAVGTVKTVAAGSSATVTNSGDNHNATLNFTIPQGVKGDKGDTGDAATIAVGTVVTGAAGSSATVTNSGTTKAAVLDMSIPKGDKGDKGDTGNGIANIVKTSTTGLIDIYTITMDNGATYPVQVTNGKDGVSIQDWSLLSTVGKVHTYRLTLSNGAYYDVPITDGKDGEGAGDMLKSVYDTNDSGVVDNAEKVNSHTVGIDVPEDAKFTDTIASYSESSILAANWNGDKYSFEDNYPKTANDISIEPSNAITMDQYKSWCKAKIVGSSSTNILKALGTIPTIDIPVIIGVTKK